MASRVTSSIPGWLRTNARRSLQTGRNNVACTTWHALHQQIHHASHALFAAPSIRFRHPTLKRNSMWSPHRTRNSLNKHSLIHTPYRLTTSPWKQQAASQSINSLPCHSQILHQQCPHRFRSFSIRTQNRGRMKRCDHAFCPWRRHNPPAIPR
jgi:hypothetical protein